MMADMYITLDGIQYMLSTDPDQNFPYSEETQNPYSTQSSYLDNMGEYWKGRTYRSFHGGERVKRLLASSDIDNMAYYDGEGVSIYTWGEISLQPALVRSLTISSATMPMCVSADGLSVVVGVTKDDTGVGDNQYIRRYNAATWTSITTPNSGAVTDLMTAPNGTMYGVQGTHVITSTDGGATWANDATSGVPTDMLGVTHCAGYLYTVGPTGLKKYNGAAWEVSSALPGTCVCNYREDVYWAKNATIFRWTGEAAYQYDQLPAGFIITALIPFREVMFIMGYYAAQGAKRGAVHYILGGHEAHLFTIRETDTTSDYRVSAACGGDDEIWFANGKRGGTDRYDLTDGGLSSGPAWGAAGIIPFKSMAYSNGYLFVGRYDNTAGTDGVYVANVMNPSTYRSTGWLSTPEDDLELPAQYKLFRSVEIAHKALAAGESIAIAYSVDGGVTWTTAGTSSTAGATSAKYALPAVRGKTLALKYTLTAGTTNLTTPTVVTPCATIEYAPIPESTYQHTVRLAIYKTKSGDQKITALKTTIAKRTVVSYTSYRGSTVDVLIVNAAFMYRAGDNDTSTVILKLREVA